MKKMTRMTKRRRIAALCAALILLICAVAGTAEEDPYEGLTPLWAMCKSYVIVRAAPRKRAKEMGWIDAFDQVWTDGVKSGKYIHLCMLQLDGGEGWVHGGYFVEDEPVAIDRERYRVNSNGRVALRRTVDGRRRAWAKPGANLTVYMISAEWALTNRGYIRSEFIEPDPE